MWHEGQLPILHKMKNGELTLKIPLVIEIPGHMKIKNLFIVLVVLFSTYFLIQKFYPRPAKGILAPDDPVQDTIFNNIGFNHRDCIITPLAEFRLKAKVLSKKKYDSDPEADLAPVDLALGWGQMSDEKVLKKISITQANRRYIWHVDEFPIPGSEISTHSANMHLIPATDEIRCLIENVKKGRLVELSGSLVKVEFIDNRRWISSLIRTDTGDGACEVVYVEEFRIL